ncbi:MAG TPA: prenyltransferase/squalene oxidase repeat-containing protein [Chthoniobacteraceae bacterium]|jgi:hypothetical protein|nr:prenyltransferase/squalene oxidase repeat-containing protein [Chthoniobacteraceae bacterium]
MKTRFVIAAILAAFLIAVRAFAADQPDIVTVDPDTDAVIHGALAWLAQQQGLDGSWSQSTMGGEPVAMTGYALMAFIATGNLPDDGEYGRNVTSGMQYLLNQIQPDGIFRAADRGKYMYNHGIATVALSELYGETRSPILRPRLEQLVSVILGAQSSLGGWRYTPTSRDADISVTVLQVAALRAAKNAGLAVPQDTIDRAVAYIGQCYDDASGGFTYQPRNRQPGFARTAAAIYSLQVCGKYNDPMVSKGSDYLFGHDKDTEEWWPYGCYYAAPAEYMIGGDTWKRWYDEMKTRLLSTAIHQGDTVHWDERRSRQLGPVYDTAVFITILATPYHYVPLYQR